MHLVILHGAIGSDKSSIIDYYNDIPGWKGIKENITPGWRREMDLLYSGDEQGDLSLFQTEVLKSTDDNMGEAFRYCYHRGYNVVLERSSWDALNVFIPVLLNVFIPESLDLIKNIIYARDLEESLEREGEVIHVYTHIGEEEMLDRLNVINISTMPSEEHLKKIRNTYERLCSGWEKVDNISECIRTYSETGCRYFRI